MSKRRPARAGGNRAGLADRAIAVGQQRRPNNTTFAGTPPLSSAGEVALSRLQHSPIWPLLEEHGQQYIILLIAGGLTPYAIAAVDDRLSWAAVAADQDPQNYGNLWLGGPIPVMTLLVRNRWWRVIDFTGSMSAACRQTRGRA